MINETCSLTSSRPHLQSICNATLTIAVVICLLLGPGETVGLPGVSSAQAQTGEPVVHTFVLGLKAPELRNREGALALQERLRARLVAMSLLDHKFTLDPQHHEVEVQVTARLERGRLERLLTSPGRLEVVPLRPGDAEVLSGVASMLPEEMGWAEERGADGRVLDAYFHGPTPEPLRAFASRIALAEGTIYIAPTLNGDKVRGWRSYLVTHNTPRLSAEGLGAVNIASHGYPNFYYLTVMWEDVEPDVTNDKPQRKSPRRLSGSSGLRHITAWARGGRLLLLSDGTPLVVVSAPEVIDTGQLTIRLPLAPAVEQLAMARQVAGYLAAAPHPCAVVVLSASTRNR